ncbi:MAG: Ig-like domain-containing protein [Opitutae bacterium]|nr:Ig-like domain-containing protein [Opitutae bacterium]
MVFLVGATAWLCAQTVGSGVALVRHAPTLNGDVEGSVQQMLPESTTLNGNTTLTGDLLVPGTPTVRLNGKPAYAGTLDGTGASAPTSHTITLNGNAALRHVVRRTDAVALPTVSAPLAPTGTRSVAINAAGQSPGDFATLRHLTLNGNVGQYAVPPGAYGNFTANGNSGFTLGIAGATVPAVYHFQNLTLNGNTQCTVVGPVIVTLAGSFSVNGNLGAAAHPEWLQLRLASGGLTLNGNVTVAAYVTAPAGTITINGNAALIGGAVCDRLTVNGNSTLRLIALAPQVALTAPAAGAVLLPATPLTLQATASDSDGWVRTVAFYNGATKLGETSAPTSPSLPTSYSLPLSTGLPPGTYTLTAQATDNANVTTKSAPVAIVVNAPPTVALTAPTSGTVVNAPAQITLQATAADNDGTVTKVEFFQGATKLGETSTPVSASLPSTYRFTLSASLPPGSYVFTARATDDRGAATVSSAATVLVNALPTVAFTTPTPGAMLVAPAQVTLQVTAADTDGTVAKVEFYQGATKLGETSTPVSPSLPTSYRFSLSSTLPPGTYLFLARTYDNNGATVDSAPITVTVLASLPYTADFEPGEGYAAGSLAGQLGWTVNQGTAQITAQAAAHGGQAILLSPGTPPAQIEQAFAPLAGATIIFVDFFAKPAALADVTSAPAFQVESALFGFALSGANGGLRAFHGDGAGGGQWTAANFTAPVGADRQAAQWLRLTARLDFTRKTWDLYANGNLVAADLGLRDRTRTYLSSFFVQGDTATATLVDYLFAGPQNPLFADANNNGLDDDWETAHGLSLAANNRDADPDGDGLSNVQECARGTDPQEYYNGALPVLTSLVASTGLLDAQGLVAVRVTKADGTLLANAPLTFVTTTGIAKLAATLGGTAATLPLSVRTDAQGIAKVYATFATFAPDTVVATARNGAQTQTLSITINPPLTDTDNNGLPDLWEQKYFGRSGIDPAADPDGDGLTNLQEYQQSKDPDDYYNGALPNVTSLLGAGGELGSDGALAVKVTDQSGAILINAPVKFSARQGGHLLAPTPTAPGMTEIQVRTDAQGIAKAFVKPSNNQP